jgi:hypothetical protein
MQDATVYKKWDLRDTYSEDFDCDVFIHAAADTGYEKSKQVMITQNALFNKKCSSISKSFSLQTFYLHIELFSVSMNFWENR